MNLKERKRKFKDARNGQKYAAGNRVTAIRFTEINLDGLNALAKKNGMSRNTIVNAMVSQCLADSSYE